MNATAIACRIDPRPKRWCWRLASRAPALDATTYPGIDLLAPAGAVPARFTHRDGGPYPDVERSQP